MSEEATLIGATVHDGEGSFTRRTRLHALGLVTLGAWLAWTMTGHDAALWPPCIAFAALVGARPFTLRAPPRDAMISLKRGRIRARGVTGLSLRARDVVGATTARMGPTFVLSVAVRGRPLRPIHFEVASLSDLEALCRALGVGHDGVGSVAFPVAAASGLGTNGWRAASATSALVAALCLAGGETGAAFASLFVMGALLLAMSALFTRFFSPRSSAVVMHRDGLEDTQRRARVAYAHLAQVRVEPHMLILEWDTLPPTSTWLASRGSALSRQAPSPREREILAAQLDAASLRAHGRNALKEGHPAAVEHLRRGADSNAAWLARLDVIASQLGAKRSAYRASTFTAHDLWAVFEDPDQDAELRGAAGRILRKLSPDEARVRVAPVLDTVREKAARKRIAATLDAEASDPDNALDEMDRAARLRRRLG